MKIKKLYIFLFFLIILLIPAFVGRWNVAEGVTVENIRKIKFGMDVKDVIRILGKPLFYMSKENNVGEKRYDAKSFFMDKLEKNGAKGCYVLIYAKDYLCARWSPALWISINNGKVIDVTAKRYYLFFDDSMIYSVRAADKYESPLFVQSFPKGKDYKEEDIDEFLKERGIKVD